MAKVTHDQIVYGTTMIAYEIKYCPRKTLGIVVHPDGSVLLKAPEDANQEQLQQRVRRRAAWILRQQRYFASFGEPMPERKYISGESHLYLGRQYMLRVVIDKQNHVEYHQNILEVHCRKPSVASRVLQRWYRERAEIKLHEYATPIVERFKTHGVEPNGITLRPMEKRWGYCTSEGDVFLNPDIIRAHRACIEYVITHELCHLIYRNHTKAFYALLSQELPHWERYKNRLEIMLF